MDLGSILEGYKEQAQFNPDLEHDVQNFTNEQADLSATQLQRRAIITTDGFAALSGGMVAQDCASRRAPPGGAALSTAGWIAGLAAKPATRVFGREPETDRK